MKRPAAAAALETVPAKRPAAKVTPGWSRQITGFLMIQVLPQSQLAAHPILLQFLAQEPLRRMSVLHTGVAGSKNGVCA